MPDPKAFLHDPPLLKDFQATLQRWFVKHGRDLPWRRTKEPWHILVSEIMLQQTTVASVIASRRYEQFLEEFPNLLTIAEATEPQLLKAWEGLGYYNRIRNLQKTAIHLISSYKGDFPRHAGTLETLPGIGKYTAGAVASFAFNFPAPIVEANIARVLARIFDYSIEVDSSAGIKQLWKWAAELLDQDSPRIHNSALMELGQTICAPKNPACSQCPVAAFCTTQSANELPKKKSRRKLIKVNEYAVLSQKDSAIYLVQEKGNRRNGFWRFPLVTEDRIAHLEPISSHQYTITHHQVTLHLYNADFLERGGKFFSPSKLEEIPIISPVRKIIRNLI